MNELQKCAEILVEYGYAERFLLIENEYWIAKTSGGYAKVNPFSDTLEGRRQADAIEDWLSVHNSALWEDSIEADMQCFDRRLSQLDRIKWCIQQLIEGESDESASS